MTDLKKLRELAVDVEGTAFESENFNGSLLVDYVCYEGEIHFGFEMPKSLRDFIAAANPETVLALLDRIEKLERIAQDFASHCDDCALLYSYDDENVKCNCGLQLALEKAEVP